MYRLWLIITLIFVTGCSLIPCTDGEGEIIEKTIDAQDFHNIHVWGAADVRITQADDYVVQLSGYENILDMLETRVHDNTLTIGQAQLSCYRSDPPLQVVVEVPAKLRDVHIAGSGNIILENRIITQELDLKVSGSGSIEGDVDVIELKTTISGAGQATISGSAIEHSTTIGGSGVINALELETKDTVVNIGGSGDAKVYVHEDLSVRIGGSGSVQYKGDPKVSEHIAGAGSVTKVEE